MRNGLYKLIFSILLVGGAISSSAQTVADTNKIAATADTTKAEAVTNNEAPVVKKMPFVPNPKKAGMYSAILPGAGQFYNRQYWKVGVLYAGVATAVYFFEFNLNKYNDYHTAYINRVANAGYTDKYTGLYTTDNIKTLQDQYKKYLDLTVLMTGVGYMLQIMDAVVYAYLHNFDVSRDISFHMRTVPTPEGATIGVVYIFK